MLLSDGFPDSEGLIEIDGIALGIPLAEGFADSEGCLDGRRDSDGVDDFVGEKVSAKPDGV